MRSTTATMRDVATAAGVSVSTVSKVLNGRDGVAGDTALRVASAMDALRYVPNAAAQRLRGGGGTVVVVLVADLDGWTEDVLRGVAAAATVLGVELITAVNFGCEAPRVWERRVLARLRSSVDGAVVVAPGESPPDVGMPVVTVERPVAGAAMTAPRGATTSVGRRMAGAQALRALRQALLEARGADVRPGRLPVAAGRGRHVVDLGAPVIETVRADQVDEAGERVMASDARDSFVIDIATRG